MPIDPYTDYLGTPVKVGDTIVYPVASGSSSATLTIAVIEAIDDIVLNNPSDPTDRSGYLHKERHDRRPTTRIVAGKRVADGTKWGKYVRDDSKAYMLKARRIADGSRLVDSHRSVTLKNVDRIVVVTPMVKS